MINWTKENNAKLETMWNEGKDDIDIAKEFGAGLYAIGKQRSNLGLVKFKKRKGMHRLPRTVMAADDKPFYVAHYQTNGVNHFSRLDTEDEEKAKALIRNLIYKQKLSSVILMQPIKKLIVEKITEVKL